MKYLILFLFPLSALALEPKDVEPVAQFLVNMLSGYPVTSTILMVVGGLRLINKPLMSLAKNYVEYTPYDSDDKLYEKVKSSKIYEWLSWFLDLFASVKPPKKKK